MFEISLSSQQIFFTALLFMVLLFIVFVLPVQKISAKPYERLNSILTPAEQRFYKVLASTINGQAIIMAKVRIADLVKVRNSIKKKHFWSYFNRISQKHIDFVLIDPSTFKTICLIELDDKSHYRFSRSERDRFVNQVMEQTGIPLYHFRVRRRYDHQMILNRLEECLKG